MTEERSIEEQAAEVGALFAAWKRAENERALVAETVMVAIDADVTTLTMTAYQRLRVITDPAYVAAQEAEIKAAEAYQTAAAAMPQVSYMDFRREGN